MYIYIRILQNINIHFYDKGPIIHHFYKLPRHQFNIKRTFKYSNIQVYAIFKQVNSKSAKWAGLKDSSSPKITPQASMAEYHKT